MAAKTETVETTVAAVEAVKPFNHEEYLNEKVPFVAPLIKKDDPDLFVSVNGRKFLIQRGKTVMLPRYVAEHLASVDSQKAYIMELQTALQAKLADEQLR